MNWFAHHGATRNRARQGSIFFIKNTRYGNIWYKSLTAFVVLLTRLFLAKPSFKRLCQQTDSESRNKLYELIHGASSFPLGQVLTPLFILSYMFYLGTKKNITIAIFCVLSDFKLIFDKFISQMFKMPYMTFQSLL